MPVAEIADGALYALRPVPPAAAEIWSFFKKQQAQMWTAEELDLASDLADWKALAPEERRFLKHVLAFFATSDGIVNENLMTNFAEEVRNPQARAFYAFQEAVEVVHQEVYGLLLETYVGPRALVAVDDAGTLRHELFDDAVHKQGDAIVVDGGVRAWVRPELEVLTHAVTTMPCVARKADFMRAYMSRGRPFAERLLAFACVEGIFFSGSFCAVFWMRKRGKLPGLCFANELIARDEGLHTDFACYLYNHMDLCALEEPAERLPRVVAERIVRDAVRIEEAFCTEALNVALIGINAELMCEYIRFVADRLLRALGYPPTFEARNPFPWMDLISMEGKTNFFERRVGEYALAGVGAEDHRRFTTEEDF